MESTAQLAAGSSPDRAGTIKAVRYERYGALDQLTVRDQPRPTIGPDDVLVRVRAASLHVGDLFSVHGAPFPVRLETGLWKPKRGVPGFDLAGDIAAVGANVTQLRAGERVFGLCQGSCAELVATAAKQLARMPDGLDYEQAAALPTSGGAALHAIRDVAKVQPGQQVLINGAAGGVGSFAVQIAKALGARVTGVCSTRNLELVRSLGADAVIDYTRENFTEQAQRYDVILDNIENHTLEACRRALTPTGLLICNSGTGAQGLALIVRLLKPLVVSPFVRQSLRRYVSFPSHDDLVALRQLVEAGSLRAVVDETFALHETAAALAHIAGGHARGKVVVRV